LTESPSNANHDPSPTASSVGAHVPLFPLAGHGAPCDTGRAVPKVHASAEVSDHAQIGQGTAIWHHAQVREGAEVGEDCIVGKGAYIDTGVRIGSRCKIQNGAFLYKGVTLQDGVFVGPGAIFANDQVPRAINPDGARKAEDDWEVGRTFVDFGASIGAGAIVLPGVHIGRFAMVAAGAVVRQQVADFEVVAGVPARALGFVCACGTRLPQREAPVTVACTRCGRSYDLSFHSTGTRCAPVADQEASA
jgi:UDP-2-acetamido-3-amino-2,3-dideoxy-glucuronate N-acetyltransferase